MVNGKLNGGVLECEVASSNGDSSSERGIGEEEERKTENDQEAPIERVEVLVAMVESEGKGDEVPAGACALSQGTVEPGVLLPEGEDQRRARESPGALGVEAPVFGSAGEVTTVPEEGMQSKMEEYPVRPLEATEIPEENVALGTAPTPEDSRLLDETPVANEDRSWAKDGEMKAFGHVSRSIAGGNDGRSASDEGVKSLEEKVKDGTAVSSSGSLNASRRVPVGPKGPAKTTSRLFTKEELDAVEVGERGVIESEDEEYEKEIEDRLYPLDEVELRKRVALNLERSRDRPLSELSTELGIPEETLARVREGSPGVLATPEYWQAWFTETLDGAHEAKRATRDFRSDEVDAPGGKWSSASERQAAVNAVSTNGELCLAEAAEDDVYANVGYDLRAYEDPAGTSAKRNPERDLEGQQLPPTVRTAVRQAAYLVLRESAETEKDFDEEELESRFWGMFERLCPDVANNDSMREWVSGWALVYLVTEGPRVAAQIQARAAKGTKLLMSAAVAKKKRTKQVTFDVSALFTVHSEAISTLRSRPENENDASHYVLMVRPVEQPSTTASKLRQPGLVSADSNSEEPEVGPSTVVASGHRIIGSVGSLETLSYGTIECLPTKLLIDTGASTSLVDQRILRLLGRLGETLEPHRGKLHGASGHAIKTLGIAELTVCLGTMEIRARFVVADRLHVDAILGTDVLEAFRAVVDVEGKSMTLKATGEKIPLGALVVEATFEARTAATLRLPPGRQVLAVADVQGPNEDGSIVMTEGVSSLDPTLRVARSLSTVRGGKVVVELCNASPEEVIITKGTMVAAATIIPQSAFEFEKDRDPRSGGQCSRTRSCSVTTSKTVKNEGREVDGVLVGAEDLTETEETLLIDFSDSKLTPAQQGLMAKELNAFRDLFVDSSKKPGRTDMLEFHIDTGSNRPIKQPPYRVSKAEGDVMEAEIQQYQELGLIQPSTSPWASPVLMIRKPDGGIRFCIDYRRLNAVTVKDCYPMPLIDDILDVLGNARLFSTMDIASGYWNVPMAADSVAKTAFACKFGLFEWLVMPFGLCNAVPAFERLMETVLVDLKWRTCLVYLDDCVVFSNDFPTHLIRLRQVLGRFRSAGFKLKMKKCHWGRSQVAFLGHIITPSGILPNPEKVKSVLNVARPHDIHTLRAFLGLTSYFRRYIPGYATITAPLERLKAKDVRFEWSEDCDSAFLQLKRLLAEPPILVYPDFSKRFKLFVDASRLGVGACLMQTVDQHDRAVAYASKLLIGSQKNWIRNTDGISEIECWGVVWATRKFRCYLDRNEFDLYTDHKALTWVFNEGNRTGNSKLARWAMELSQLKFKVYHRAGTLMGHVDGLSRMYPRESPTVKERDKWLSTHANAVVNAVGERADPKDEEAKESERGESYDPWTQVAPPFRRWWLDEDKENSDRPALGGSVGSGAEDPAPGPGTSRNVGPSEAGTNIALDDSPVESDREEDTTPAQPGVSIGEDDAEEATGPLSPIDAVGLDAERFLESQARTPWMRVLTAFLESGALPIDPVSRARVLRMAPRFTVLEGILRRRVVLPAQIGPVRSRSVPVIPVEFIETVLHFCHSDIFSAHLGVTKTVEKVRRHAFWHGWRKDATEFVRACALCGGGKGYRPWNAGLMQRMPVLDLSGPFSLLVVDAVGPLVTTSRGNKFILVFADYFSRWVEAFAVSSLDTVTFVETMIDGVICRHGVPERLLSDQGTNFTSALAKSLYDTLGIKKLFSSAYHPQTQGLVERFNGTLLGMLKMFVSEAQTDWDIYLPRVLFAYRTSYHETLKDSPFYSLYGRDPVLPLDLAFLNDGPKWRSNEVAQYRRTLASSFRASRRLVERQLIKAQERNEARLAGQVAVEYEVGDPVWVYQYFRAKRGEKRSKKLAFSWHGPYRVVEAVGPNAYRIDIPSHPDKIVTINVNRLKPFRGRWSRPAAEEGPFTGPEGGPDYDENGPLEEEDLPRSSYVERMVLGSDDTAFTEARVPVVDVVGKRSINGLVEYLVLTATYETFWLSRGVLLPRFSEQVLAYENSERRKQGIPELRRSARLAKEKDDDSEDDVLL